MTVYRASADGLVMGITALVVVILGAVAAGGLAAALFSRMPGVIRLVLLFPAVLCLGILLVAYAYTPRSFELDDTALVVSRLAGNVTVQLRDVAEVRSVPNPLSGSMRIGGNGGLFGFWGRYHSAALGGNFTMYGTRASGGVALVGKDQTIVVTPDDPDRFIVDVQRRLGQRAAG
jgi:hypothetical protein